MALASSAVADASFDIERAIHRPRSEEVMHRRHVFVAGLARAGTTIVMRLLHRTGAYRSLTYRDMPFVLAPNLWDRISSLSRRHMTAEERAHGDGVLVDFDSPEALEEVFWRAKCGRDYIRPGRLAPMSADRDVVQDFRDYVALLLKRHPGKRYLSKNNNNLLRLPSLIRCFPDAVIVVPFREPLQHACSLMGQHHNFLERHGADRFSRRYMGWLVHHEFGADHRPFVFDDAAPRRSPQDGLGYWLQMWINVYGFIVATAPERCVLLSYDRLCERSGTVWAGLCSRLNLPPQPAAEPLHPPHRWGEQEAVSADLLHRARALHDTLCARAI